MLPCGRQSSSNIASGGGRVRFEKTWKTSEILPGSASPWFSGRGSSVPSRGPPRLGPNKSAWSRVEIPVTVRIRTRNGRKAFRNYQVQSCLGGVLRRYKSNHRVDDYLFILRYNLQPPCRIAWRLTLESEPPHFCFSKRSPDSWSARKRRAAVIIQLVLVVWFFRSGFLSQQMEENSESESSVLGCLRLCINFECVGRSSRRLKLWQGFHYQAALLICSSL